MKKNFLRLIIIGIVVIPTFVFADKIVLKTGKVLQGTVENQENNIVTLTTSTGEKIQVKKEEIVSMIYAEQKIVKKPTPPKPKPESVTDGENGNTNRTTQVTGERIQVNNNEKITEKTEKVTIDKELTNSVMQKFEDADKRRLQATNSEIDVLKAELEYLKKERERMQKLNQGDEDFKKTMDKRMASLEIRIRRLEKDLGMDESMVDYYQRKRSPWDLVWRSAIFPGWGHRYAREEYTGNAYSTSIIVLYLLHYFIDYQTKAAEDVAKTALFNDAVVKAYQYSSLGIPASFSNTMVASSFSTYASTVSAIDTQKELAGNFLNAAIGLYLIQLVHSYFTGVEWAKVQPRDYSNEGLLKPTGFNFKSKPDSNFQTRIPERGIRYEMEFTTHF